MVPVRCQRPRAKASPPPLASPQPAPKHRFQASAHARTSTGGSSLAALLSGVFPTHCPGVSSFQPTSGVTIPAATPRWHSYLGSHRLPASKALSCRAIPLSLGRTEGRGMQEQEEKLQMFFSEGKISLTNRGNSQLFRKLSKLQTGPIAWQGQGGPAELHGHLRTPVLQTGLQTQKPWAMREVSQTSRLRGSSKKSHAQPGNGSMS